MSQQTFIVTAVQIFYRNSMFISQTHVHMKASSATKQCAFGIE